MWSRSRTEPARATLAIALVVSGLAGCLLGGCSDIYYDRRDTVALSAEDHIDSNRVAQMVDPWPRDVGNKNIAFNGERIQAGVERYRRHEVIQPMPLTTNSYDQQRPPPPLTTEHVPIGQPAPASAAAAPVAGAKP